MDSLQKQKLYQKWNCCDRATRIRLACEYLKLLRSDGEKVGWLEFLVKNLEEM